MIKIPVVIYSTFVTDEDSVVGVCTYHMILLLKNSATTRSAFTVLPDSSKGGDLGFSK
jgi:hypothetical protein